MRPDDFPAIDLWPGGIPADVDTDEAVELLAWWDERVAESWARTLGTIRRLPERVACPRCVGLGVDPAGPRLDCHRCNGTGSEVR